MNYRLRPIHLACMVMVLLATPLVRAQADSTMYLVFDCMKSTSPDYVQVEKDIWQPMHQEMVDRGEKEGWGLFAVTFGSRDECDYLTVNRYLGAEALNNAYTDLSPVFAKVHPGEDFDEALARTDKSRKVMSTYLRAVVGGIPPSSFQYVHVNLMSAKDGNAYVNHEMSVFKPVHQALVDDGITKGWYLEALVRPYGSAIGYNFATADFTDNPGPIPFGKYLAKVHPDKSVGEIFQEMDATRDLVLSQTWRVLARTTPRK